MGRGIRTGSYGFIKPTHNLSHIPTYGTWKGMVSRCTNPKDSGYRKYGAKEVTVCERWIEPDGKGFINFLEDMGERPEGLTLNRIGSSKTYSKENCEWTDSNTQSYDQVKRLDNTSGKTGVSWNKTLNKWVSYIDVLGKRISLGVSKDISVAINLREQAEIKYYGKIKE